MTVIKRNGSMEKFDFTKIDKHLAGASFGLPNINISKIKDLITMQLRDGMQTSEIEEILRVSAISLMEFDTPLYSIIATRLALYTNYHEVLSVIGDLSFRSYLNYHINKGRMPRKILNFYEELLVFKNLNDVQFMQKYIPWDDDAYCFKYDSNLPYSATIAILDKNIIKENGKYAEIPQFMHLANELSLYAGTNDYDLALQSYLLRATRKKSWATPPTTNARKTNPTLASCYAMVAPDTIEGLMDILKDVALTSKAGAGDGIDITHLRTMGSSIDGNKNASGGIAPSSKMIESVVKAIDQLGVRPGCAHLYMQPWHGDVEAFIDLKKTHGDADKRTHKLLTSLWVNNLFMERVEEDGDWSLFCPSETPELITAYGEEFDILYKELEKTDKVLKVVSAKKLYKESMRTYFEDGGPMLSFKDEHNRRNQNKHAGHIYSSNLCTEISQNTSPTEIVVVVKTTNGSVFEFKEADLVITNSVSIKASKISRNDIISVDSNKYTVISAIKETRGGEMLICNLASVNLGEFTTMKDFEETVRNTVIGLNRITRLNNFISDKVVTSTNNYFAIALGTMGEHEFLAKRKIHYGSPEHLAVIDVIYSKFSEITIKTSAQLSETYGSYGKFEGSDWSKGILPIDTANTLIEEEIDRTIDVSKYIGEYNEPDFDSLRELVKKGMANGYLMAPAPTASISISTGTTSSTEPVYQRMYTEENSSGLVKTMVPSLSPDTWDYYKSAFEYDQYRLILAAAVRQKWVDQALSTNIFINDINAKMSYLNMLFQSAKKFGLKGLYYIRSLSPEEDINDRAPEEIKCIGCE